MSESVRTNGKTVEDAIDAALAILRAAREEVDVKVLSEGEGGLLGIGARPAEVEVWLKKAVGEDAKGVLQHLLDRMKFLTLVELVKEEGDTVTLDIRGEDMGRIIGKMGATIDALQFITALMLSKKAGRRIRVLVDAGGYRERRAKKIQGMAREAAEKAQFSDREVILEPMNAAERRLVHLAIKDNPEVFSLSKGERANRRVVIAPKSQQPPEDSESQPE